MQRGDGQTRQRKKRARIAVGDVILVVFFDLLSHQESISTWASYLF